LPTFIYVAEHGRDTKVGRRLPGETDALGLALTQLVLPIKGDRIPALAHVTEHYLEGTTVPEPGETADDTLGVVGVFGLLYLAISLAACCVSGGGGIPDRPAVRAALGASMAFLIGTVGGLGTLFAFLVNPEIRAPNRIAVFIGFFALFGVALALERLRKRLRGRRLAKAGFAMALVSVLAIGALDQTSPAMIPNYGEIAAQYNSDAGLVHAIERQVPANAAIFQLPIIEFPEGTAPDGEAWEQFVGYLHSSHLRWSYGAMSGRSTDWQAALAEAPLTSLLPAVSAVGFSGIAFDSFEYANHGAAIVSELSRELGVSPIVSADRGLYFFDMASYNQRLRQRFGGQQLASLAQATLHPGGG
jgi:phosphoglycerol transferase